MQSKTTQPTRTVKRTRVAPGIWKREGADGRPRYEITYRDSDLVQRRQVVEGGKRAAEVALAKVKSDKGQGKRVAPSPRLTFGEAAERWYESQANKLRPTTRQAYRSSLDAHLLPAWGRIRLDRIDVDVVASLVERMQSAEYRAEAERRTAQRHAAERRAARKPARQASKLSGKAGYEPWTIRGVLVAAGRVFDFSRRRLGWAGTNPVRDLDRGERPRHEQHERRILSRDDLAKVIEAADEPHATIIATAAGLGTRLGETLGLRWRDLDFDVGTATVRFQIDRFGSLVELKTERSRRVVEVPGSVLSKLRAHKLSNPRTAPDDLVFTSRSGGPLEHRNVAQRGLGKAYEAAKLEGRAPTFHELRHAHASAWIANGGDLVELSARLGHRDPAITASTYSHEFEAASRSPQRRARLDAIYGADAPPSITGDAAPQAAQASGKLVRLRRT
jgi:integrase